MGYNRRKHQEQESETSEDTGSSKLDIMAEETIVNKVQCQDEHAEGGIIKLDC